MRPKLLNTFLSQRHLKGSRYFSLKSKALLLLLFFSGQLKTVAQTTLTQGDLSFVGMSGVNSTPKLAFVTWVSLANGTVIKFTDNTFNSHGSNANAALNANTFASGVIYWTATSAVPAGTVITIAGTNSLPVASIGSVTVAPLGNGGNGFWTLGNGGRTIWAYQYGNTSTTNDFTASGSPTETYQGATGSLICALVVSGSGLNSFFINSGSSSSKSSYVPADFDSTYSTTGLSLTGANVRSAYYLGPTSGFSTIAAAKASVNTHNGTNWGVYFGPSDNTVPTYVGNFTLPSTNTAPTFTNSNPQSLSVCKNSGATSINTLLTVSDIDASQTETWTVTTAPSHGTLAGFSATASSGSTSITPAGLSYTPATGYSGSDNFVIQVSDGIATGSMTVNVTVNPLPSIGISGGTSPICTGGSGTILTGTGGTTYVWSPGSGLSATTGASVTANPGSSTTYSVTGSNGTCSNLATIALTVNATPASISGTMNFPVGTNSALSDATTGGTWTSTNTGVATIGSVSGVATGLSSGTTIISYTIAGCSASSTITVNAASSFTWYSSTSGGDASILGNWWSNNNSTGYQPTSFATTATTWIFQSAMTGTSALTFAGNVSITSGGSFAPLSGSTTTVGGNWLNSGGTFSANGGTVIFNGANSATADTLSGSMTGSNAFYNLSFNSPAIGYTFLGNPADVNGDFVQVSGAVTAPSGNLTVSGDFNHNGGTFAPNGGTLLKKGASSTLTVTGMTSPGTNCLHNLSFNATLASTYTISSDLVLTGSFTNLNANATMDLGSHTLTVGRNWSNPGPFTQGPGHSIIYNGTGSPITVSGNQ